MLKRITNLLEDENLMANEWEKSFLKSTLSQVSQYERELNFNQVSVLERIEEQNTPEARQENEEFRKLWESDAQLRERTVVVCKYYEFTEYYRPLTFKILETDYALTKREYNKLCKNKYALRVLEEHYKEPRFKVNNLVQIRAANTINKNLRSANGGWTRLNDAYAIVIEVNALPIRRSAKGAKIYKILPVGGNRTYYVHESDLKKPRKQ
jgi:hypothetical protein